MHGGSGRAQSFSAFERQRPSSPALSSSPAPFQLSHLVAGPSRSSSVALPSPKSGPRFRTIVHPENHVDRELRHKLLQSRARLDTAFDAIAERYSSVHPEDDDEIDLWDLTIKKNRGAIDTLEPRLFAEGSDYLDEAVEDEVDGIRFDRLRMHTAPVLGPDKVQFGEDEDELGDWGEKSGLDPQYPIVEIENDWTTEDLCDLDQFLQAEAARRKRNGEEKLPASDPLDSIPSSSPLQRLRQLALEGSSDEADVGETSDDAMNPPQRPNRSSVASAGEDTVSTRHEYVLIPQLRLRRRSSTPPSMPLRHATPSSPTAPRRLRSSTSKVRPPARGSSLSHSRSAPNLPSASQPPARRNYFPDDLSHTINGLSRSTSGHIVQFAEQVSTFFVTIQGHAEHSRSRKGKERALPPERERDREAAGESIRRHQATESTRRPSSRYSTHPGSAGPSSGGRSIQSVTTVTRTECWVSSPPSPTTSKGRKATYHQPPGPLWPSSPGHVSQPLPSSSEPPPSPLDRKAREAPSTQARKDKEPPSTLARKAREPSSTLAWKGKEQPAPQAHTAKEPPSTPPSSALPSSPQPTPNVRPPNELVGSSGSSNRDYTDQEERTRVRLPRGETPGYCTTLTFASSTSPKACRACKEVPGERASFAAYCRGRNRPHLCPYYEEGYSVTSQAMSEAVQDVSRQISLQPGPQRPATSAVMPEASREVFKKVRVQPRTQTPVSSTAMPEASREVSTQASAQPCPRTSALPTSPVVSPPKDHPRYFSYLAQSRGTPRTCRACKSAGGERAALAVYCRGRTRPRFCAHAGDDLLTVKKFWVVSPASKIVTDAVASKMNNVSPRQDNLPSPAPSEDISPLSSPIRDAAPPARVNGPSADYDDKPWPSEPPLASGQLGRYVLSPDSSDAESDEGDDGDGGDSDRFSAYEPDAAEEDDEDDWVSDDEDEFFDSQSQPDVEIFDVGDGDHDQLLVDRSKGAVANYSLPLVNEEGSTVQAVFREIDGVFDLARCAQCVLVGGGRAERSMWCPGRDSDQPCSFSPSESFTSPVGSRFQNASPDTSPSEDPVEQSPKGRALVATRRPPSASISPASALPPAPLPSPRISSLQASTSSQSHCAPAQAVALNDLFAPPPSSGSVPRDDGRDDGRVASAELEQDAWGMDLDADSEMDLDDGADTDAEMDADAEETNHSRMDMSSPPPNPTPKPNVRLTATSGAASGSRTAESQPRLCGRTAPPRHPVSAIITPPRSSMGSSVEPPSSHQNSTQRGATIGTTPLRPFPSSSQLSWKSLPRPTRTSDRGAALMSDSAETTSTPRASREELDLRARDVGINLGLPHTGRLSSSLLDRLSSTSKKTVPTLASAVSNTARYTLPSPSPSARSDSSGSRRPVLPLRGGASSTPSSGAGQMLPPPVPTPRSSVSAPSRTTAPQTTPRKRYRPDPDEQSDEEASARPATGLKPKPERRVASRPRSQSMSARLSTPSFSSTGRRESTAPLSTPRKKTRMELRAEREASLRTDADELEWGMDMEVGLDVARSFRESSVTVPVGRERGGSLRL